MANRPTYVPHAEAAGVPCWPCAEAAGVPCWPCAEAAGVPCRPCTEAAGMANRPTCVPHAEAEGVPWWRHTNAACVHEVVKQGWLHVAVCVRVQQMGTWPLGNACRPGDWMWICLEACSSAWLHTETTCMAAGRPSFLICACFHSLSLCAPLPVHSFLAFACVSQRISSYA